MNLAIIKRPIVFIPALVVLAVIAVLIWRSGSDPQVGYSTAVLKKGDITATIGSTGTIEPQEVIDVGAQVAGLIKSFGNDKNGKRIDYGSQVEEGMTLARIDDSVYAADLALSQAQLEKDRSGELSAAANLEQAKARLVADQANWERADAMFGRNLIAPTDHDTARATYLTSRANVSMGEASLAQAKASVVIAQAQVAKAQRNLDFCTIKSPVRGVIIDRRVNIGQTVVASLNAPSLFLIAKDLTRMQIWVAVNEADVGRILPGGAVTFTCDAFPGREFQASVGKVRLNATMTQNVVMYTVEVNTENPNGVLLPYLTANVKFIVGQVKDALLVPNAALRWSPFSEDMVAPDARQGHSVADRGARGPDGTVAPKADGPEKPGEKFGTIWLRDGAYVRPKRIKLGLSDGTNTVIADAKVTEGQEVVTGEVVGAVTNTNQNPFGPPQVQRRR